MSKHSSAPISDFASSTLARASRSRRSRSKSIRFSQSTAIGPYVFSAISHLPRRATHRTPSKEAAILRLAARCRAAGSLLLVPQNPTACIRRPTSPLPAKRPRSLKYFLLRRYRDIFQRRRKWNRHVHRPHSLYWRLQVIERAFRDDRSDLSGHAVAAITLINHHRSRSLLRRFNQRLLIQRPGRPRINHFCAHANLFQQLGRPQRHLHHAARRHNRDVFALALHVRRTKGNRILLLRHRPFLFVHHLVFKKDHRIFVADRRLQKSLRIVGRRWHHHFQSRHMAQPRVQRLRMLRRRTSRRSQRGPQNHWHFPRPARHVMHLRGLIHQLVHCH